MPEDLPSVTAIQKIEREERKRLEEKGGQNA